MPSFSREGVGVAVEENDPIQLQAWSSVATTLLASLRIRPRDGSPTYSFQLELTVTNDRLTSSIGRQIDNGGVIDSVMIQATPKGTQAAPTQRGQCYAQLQLMHGGCLACGYVYPGHQPALNEFVEPGPAGGSGAITRVIFGPGTITTGRVLGVVPTGALWRWLAGVITYTDSATIGARSSNPVFRDALGNSYFLLPRAAGTASQVDKWTFSVGGGGESTLTIPSGTNSFETSIFDRAVIAGHDLFLIDANAIDGLDTCQFEGQVEEWVVPN